MKSLALSLLTVLLAAAPVWAEAPAKPDQAELFQQFEKTLSGARLVGNFTVTGKDTDKLRKEEYVITSVTKLDEGDYWLFKARIKYGEHDLEVPMPLQVKWAGDTPVITLDEVKIPGLGTFNSRVVIENGKYAGTWTHGKVGGHLFGVIVPLDENKEKPAKDSETN
ncbi:hypothetical protein [Lignipirellula cremea]|uniref:Uncharacterized protein n=1 Tax=Lignipirellula cremea TaxID=2528010 RepID=A0A518DW88_9BACT|nr:hypothetical protein [Lignipirellula cremea]QDU96100.1 hypothetical protein Pla8534_39190 [Lignipirellula cremea]